MQPSVWLLLEQQISAGDFIPGEILVSAGPLGTRTQSRRVEGGGGLRAGPGASRKKGAIFCIKASGVCFCAPSNWCLCSEGDWSGHALMLSFKWISDNRLRKSRRDLWLLAGAAVSPGTRQGPPPPGVNTQQRWCRKKQSHSLVNPFTSSFQSLAMVRYHAAPINLLGGAKHFLTF